MTCTKEASCSDETEKRAAEAAAEQRGFIRGLEEAVNIAFNTVTGLDAERRWKAKIAEMRADSAADKVRKEVVE